MPFGRRRRRQTSSDGGQQQPGFRPGVGQRNANGNRQGQSQAQGDMFGQAAASGGDSAWEEVLSGNKVLRRGANGPAVEALQRQLVARGQQVAVDGDFGPGTRRAVIAVQGELGLPVDGVVGGQTARALEGVSTQPARGDRGGHSEETTSNDNSTNAATTIDEINVNASSFESTGLRPRVFQKALTAFEAAFKAGDTEKLIFTVIDYELPSSEKRFWVIDLASGRLLFHEHTSHGSGSDRNHDGRADRMSNVKESGTSNVGLMRTDDTYYGKHGLSLNLDGLERGFNHNARERRVVVHSADYVDDAYIRRNGKAGRSLGCPALDPDVSGDVIRTIKGGSLVFAYYPDEKWLEQSRYLNGSR